MTLGMFQIVLVAIDLYNISLVVDNRLSMSKGTVDDFDKREEDEHF